MAVTLHMRYVTLLLFLFALAMVTTPANTQAQPVPVQAPVNDIPLVVIRYNQPRIYYDKQLYNAISKAVKIKPSVTLSLVSFIPENGSEDRRERVKNLAEKQLSKLMVDLRKMGIPRDRISVSKEYVPDARYHEVYLYVD